MIRGPLADVSNYDAHIITKNTDGSFDCAVCGHNKCEIKGAPPKKGIVAGGHGYHGENMD